MNSLLLIATTMSSVLMYASAGPMPGCMFDGKKGHMRAVCVFVEFTEAIPPRMDNEITALLISDNSTVRSLTRDSFARWPRLNELQLSFDEDIKIDDDTFEPLVNLETLFVRGRNYSRLPSSIFKLPKLTTLRIESMNLIDEQLKFDVATSPVQYLHMANNKITKLPDLRAFKKLRHLDVQSNDVRVIKVKDVAPLCSLRDINVYLVPLNYENNECECARVRNWSKRFNVRSFQDFDCPETRDCVNVDRFTVDELRMRAECLEALRYEN